VRHLRNDAPAPIHTASSTLEARTMTRMSDAMFDAAARHQLVIQFLPALARLPTNQRLTKDDLLGAQFLLHREGPLEIYYAPLDYVNSDAQVMLIGITPGWQQIEIAYRAAQDGLAHGDTPSQICYRAKASASFAGAMRRNLTAMLDDVGLPTILQIPTSNALFDTHRTLIHTTSAIRYPVFIDGKNYTGHQPALLQTAILQRFVLDVLTAELRLTNHALIIPLGKCVSDVLRLLIDKGQIDSDRCLLDFPHPSGANGHRIKQFRQVQTELAKRIQQWFSERNAQRGVG
ncbi:MAG: hypothetical protein MI924_23655, partial [Chloroflexales bacterium]|nr:hypothetical protein [Chloroflexales bacterium]